MTEILNTIEWADPIFPLVPDPKWEAKVKDTLGGVALLYQVVSPNNWLREAGLVLDAYRPSQISTYFENILMLVTAQENACRYCYGAARAQMKMLGYSESLINKLERDVQMAELTPKNRDFVQFCRSLARSKPRPKKEDRESLLAHGFSELAVAEIVFLVASHCFFNRLATFVACPPEHKAEKFTHGIASYGFRIAGPLLRSRHANKTRKAAAKAMAENTALTESAFAPILNALAPLPAARIFSDVLDQAMASPELSQRLKKLMIAVIARALNCDPCQQEMGKQLESTGLTGQQVEQCLTTLTLPDLEPFEVKILDWTRNTVHFQPGPIQKRTRELTDEIGEKKMLEAIGIASLANSLVRTATLLT